MFIAEDRATIFMWLALPKLNISEAYLKALPCCPVAHYVPFLIEAEDLYLSLLICKDLCGSLIQGS